MLLLGFRSDGFALQLSARQLQFILEGSYLFGCVLAKLVQTLLERVSLLSRQFCLVAGRLRLCFKALQFQIARMRLLHELRFIG